MDTNTLAHTTWNCKYHIVFAPKYRRQIIYWKYKVGYCVHYATGKGLRLSRLSYVPITYICFWVSLQNSVFLKSWAILKAKVLWWFSTASLILKYRYGNRQFWCRGYYVDTVGRNQKKIEEYIRNQLNEDKLSDELSRKELYDPFTGEAVVKGGKR